MGLRLYFENTICKSEKIEYGPDDRFGGINHHQYNLGVHNLNLQ